MSSQSNSQVQHNRDVSRGRTGDFRGGSGDIFEELDALETAGVAQIGVMLRGMARMGQVSVIYGARIAAEWQRMALEATKHAADAFGAPFL